MRYHSFKACCDSCPTPTPTDADARAADTYDDVWSSLASAARTADAWAASSPTTGTLP